MIKNYKERNWLYHQYIELEKSLIQIAKECNVSDNVIYYWMVKFNISRRTISEAMQIYRGPKRYRNKEWMCKQYTDLKKTPREISELCNCSIPTIVKYLRRFNMMIKKNFKVYPLLTKKKHIEKKEEKKEEIFKFRNMICPPINEMGVIVLFSLLLNDLNMEIINIQTEFPDCLVSQNKNGKKQTIRIEFEYLSNNFRLHNHDPNECDMIVCWEDNMPNWYTCPIEIIELKKIIKNKLTKI